MYYCRAVTVKGNPCKKKHVISGNIPFCSIHIKTYYETKQKVNMICLHIDSLISTKNNSFRERR